MNFFKSLFPYLFIFLIINNILIKTKIILIFGYLLQWILYPVFKIDAKSCSILLLSLISGFPSSVLYSSLFNKEIKNESSLKNIALLFFLPSLSFIFYLVRANLNSLYFTPFVIALYLPSFILLFIYRFKSHDNFITMNNLKLQIKNSFSSFDYINDLKQIFLSSNICFLQYI